MKTYPYQTPDGIIQLVEKRELDQLLERLAEARESHLAASARDVQTIQRQSVLIARLYRAISVRMSAEEPTGEERLELMHAWEEAGAFLNQSASSVRPNAAACGQCADKALPASAAEAR